MVLEGRLERPYRFTRDAPSHRTTEETTLFVPSSLALSRKEQTMIDQLISGDHFLLWCTGILRLHKFETSLSTTLEAVQ